MNFDPRLTAPQATEYLIDDISAFISSDAVASAVSQRLAGQGIQVSSGAIRSSTSSEQVHRTIDVRIVWPTADEAALILAEVINVLEQETPHYFARLNEQAPTLTPIHGPHVQLLPPTLSQRLELPVRLLLALVVGLAMVFVWDYFDTNVRNREELEAMGIHVLGSIPRKRLTGR